MNLAELLFGKPKMKGKISVEVDDEIEKEVKELLKKLGVED